MHFIIVFFHNETLGFAVRNYFPFISLRYWGFLYVLFHDFLDTGRADAGVGFFC